MDPDIVWDSTAAPQGGRVRGREAALRDYAGMLDMWSDYSVEVERVVEAGARILVVVANRGRGPASGATVVGRRGNVWELRDGRVVAFKLYLDPREAFEALGLEPPS